MSHFDFPAGHSVLVVGGAGGIGAAISRAFLGAGCDVLATGVDEAALAGSELAALSEPRLTLRVLDVTDDAGVARLVRDLDRLDVLINCAGILARFKEFEVETFRRVLDVNLIGTFRLCNACRPLLARERRRTATLPPSPLADVAPPGRIGSTPDGAAPEQGGSIVNVASMNAFVALPFIPAYCASKGGVVMLTKSLALAWAQEGIRVNAIAPGYVETPINAEGRRDRAHYERIAGRIALGRWALPDDVAGSAVFLASPAARYVTGTVLAVDGGFLAG